MVEFRVDQSLFGARNDRLIKGLGIKQWSRDPFVIMFEKVGAWFVISRNYLGYSKRVRGLFVIMFILEGGFISKYIKEKGFNCKHVKRWKDF